MFSIKAVVKSAAGAVYKKAFLSKYLRDPRIILMYHRVVEEIPAGLHDPAMFVTTGTLDMHLREISHYFDIVPLDAIIEATGKKTRLCAITFDDGWVDNYDCAFPILKNYKAPATIFIPVNMVTQQQNFWFQNLLDLASQAATGDKGGAFIQYFSSCVPAWHTKGTSQDHIEDLTDALKGMPAATLETLIAGGYEKLRLTPAGKRDIMSWDQIHEMSQQGITFGSHGLHHNILTRLNFNIKRDEIVNSFDTLGNANVAMTPFFSYPNGDWDNEAVSLVKQAGYRGAVTTQLGVNDASTDPYILRRIAIHEDISNTASLFWFRIFQATISK
jgi:peptidoglycan/xylan/chitin deacetylase (PgdA/CDA1 family)